MTQPALSVSIKRLETLLGVTIFERSRQGASLTRDGAVLFRNAEAIEHLLSRTKTEMSAIAKGAEGLIRVGGTPVAIATVIPAAIDSLLRDGINFSADIVEDVDVKLHESLYQRRLDLIVSATNFGEKPDEIEESTLYQTSMIAVSRTRELLGRNEKFRLANIGGQLVILPHGGTFRDQLDAIFFMAGVEPPSMVIQASSFLSLKATLCATDSIAFLPWQIIAHELKTGRLHGLQIQEDTGTRVIGIRTLKDSYNAPFLGQFCQRLRLVSKQFDMHWHDRAAMEKQSSQPIQIG